MTKSAKGSTGRFGCSGTDRPHCLVEPVEAVLMVRTSGHEVNRDFEDMAVQAVTE